MLKVRLRRAAMRPPSRWRACG